MRIKDIPPFERLSNLNKIVVESSSNDKTLSPEYTNKNYYEEKKI